MASIEQFRKECIELGRLQGLEEAHTMVKQMVERETNVFWPDRNVVRALTSLSTQIHAASKDRPK